MKLYDEGRVYIPHYLLQTRVAQRPLTAPPHKHMALFRLDCLHHVANEAFCFDDLLSSSSVNTDIWGSMIYCILRPQAKGKNLQLYTKVKTKIGYVSHTLLSTGVGPRERLLFESMENNKSNMTLVNKSFRHK